MAANVTLDAFLAGVAQLGSVHTGDGGFEQALRAALLDSVKLKSWATPATAQQSGVLRATRLAACRINWNYSTALEYHDEPHRWWQEQGSRMIAEINEAIDAGSATTARTFKYTEAEEVGRILTDAEVTIVLWTGCSLSVSVLPRSLSSNATTSCVLPQVKMDAHVKWLFTTACMFKLKKPAT